MRLTRKKSIELCIALWEWLAETGEQKEKWPEWDKYEDIIDSLCWLCHYNNHTIAGNRRRNDGNCVTCPYLKKYGHCNIMGSFFNLWEDAKTPRTRKKYAKLFLKQIKTLRSK